MEWERKLIRTAIRNIPFTRPFTRVMGALERSLLCACPLTHHALPYHHPCMRVCVCVVATQDAMALSYESRKDGEQITAVNRSRFLPTASCVPACGAGSFCCRSVGKANTTASCSARSCSAMGHRWDYIYEEEPTMAAAGGARVVALNVDGAPAQSFKYDDTAGGVLTYVKQNITSKDGVIKSVDMMTVEHDNENLVSGLLAFIIYPFAPEVWGLSN